MAKKARQQLENELAILKRYGAYRGIASVFNNLIKWSGLVAIVYFLSRAIDSLAGKQTVADLGVGFVVSTRTTVTLAWLFGILGIGYGWRQRKLRRDTTERLHERNKALEKRLDPNRTSSGLTPRGGTHPKDAQ